MVRHKEKEYGAGVSAKPSSATPNLNCTAKQALRQPEAAARIELTELLAAVKQIVSCYCIEESKAAYSMPSLNDDYPHVTKLCKKIEICLYDGIKASSQARKAEKFWSFLHALNTLQIKQQAEWAASQEKIQAKVNAISWYHEEFSHELGNLIEPSELVGNKSALRAAELVANAESQRLSTDGPAVKGFQSSLWIAESLGTNTTNASTLVPIWIRQCLNTHILTNVVCGMRQSMTKALLSTTYADKALMLNDEDFDTFHWILTPIDRMSFGFATFKNAQKKESLTTRKAGSGGLPKRPESRTKCGYDAFSIGARRKRKISSAVFRLLSTESKAMLYRLQFTSPSILIPQALNDASLETTENHLFRQPLKRVVAHQRTCQLALLDPNIGIPNFVEGCCRLIDAAVDTKDLFQARISLSTWQRIYSDVVKTGALSIWSHVHHATTMLQQFLLELPSPLIPVHMHDAFIGANDIEQVNQRLRNLRLLVNNLPWFARPTLERIIATMSRAVAPFHSEKNGLCAATLADVFGKLLLRGSQGYNSSTVIPVFSTRIECDRRAPAVVETLISYHQEIFADIIDELSVFRQALVDKVANLNAMVRRKDTVFDENNIYHQRRLRILWSCLLTRDTNPLASPSRYAAIKGRRSSHKLNSESDSQPEDYSDEVELNDRLGKDSLHRKAELGENQSEHAEAETSSSNTSASDDTISELSPLTSSLVFPMPTRPPSPNANYEHDDIREGTDTSDNDWEIRSYPSAWQRDELQSPACREKQNGSLIENFDQADGNGEDVFPTYIQELEEKVNFTKKILPSYEEVLRSDRWTANGFQKNPLQDLNGAGVLMLDCLIFFLEENPQISRQIMRKRAARTKEDYPFPLATLYVVKMLSQLLLTWKETSDSEQVELWPDRWMHWCDNVSMSDIENQKDDESSSNPGDSQAGSGQHSHSAISLGVSEMLSEQKCWKLLDDPHAFEKLYAMTMLLLDRNWSKANATMMDFNIILQDTATQMRRLLANSPPTMQEFWKLWIGVNQVRSARAQLAAYRGREMNITINHMRRYQITWPGGVNVRELPTLDSRRVGTREHGDIVECVAKRGCWIKLREVPGLPDAGWMATRAPNGELVREI